MGSEVTASVTCGYSLYYIWSQPLLHRVLASRWQAHAMDSEVQAHAEQRARSEAESEASPPLSSLFQPAPPLPADAEPSEPALTPEATSN